MTCSFSLPCLSLSPLLSLLSLISGCPEAVKLLVGNKCDLPADVDLSQAKVSEISLMEPHTVRCKLLLKKYKSAIRGRSSHCERGGPGEESNLATYLNLNYSINNYSLTKKWGSHPVH